MRTFMLAVLRPPPEVLPGLMERARAAAAESQDAFNALLAESPRTFVGVLGEGQRVLDPMTMTDLGGLCVGDSFVDYTELVHAMHGGKA